ncbi:MAG: tetratricopeptide repeat protein [bacterium]
MNDSRQLKKEFLHLKKQAKKHPGLFARLASLEMEQGKPKAARKRLKKGLEQFPEMTSAKTLLAECLSQLGEHESSLRQWEDVIYSEPYNARARSGYIRELAFLERSEQLADAIADLYGLDPLDHSISERHQEALLRTIRRANPSIRAWHPQWHPGDFTPAGATARDVASRLQLTDDRETIPEEVRPYTDESMADRLVAELGILSRNTSTEEEVEVEGDLEETLEKIDMEGPVSEEDRALASLFNEGEGTEPSEAADVALDDREVEIDSDSKAGVEAGEEVEIEESPAGEMIAGEQPTSEEAAVSGGGESEKEDEEPSDGLIQKDLDAAVAVERKEPAEGEPEVESETDREAPQLIPEEPDTAPPPPPDKLTLAILAAGIDAEGVFDIENLVQQLEVKEPYIVEDPVIKISTASIQDGPVDVRTGHMPPQKAEKVEKKPSSGAKPGLTATPKIDVTVKTELQKPGVPPVEKEHVREELPGEELDRKILDSVIEGKTPVESVEAAKATSKEPATPTTRETPVTAKAVDVKSSSRKQMSQDELDALIAAKKTSVQPSGERKPATVSGADATPVETSEEAPGGQMKQDALDALVAANKKVADTPLPPKMKTGEKATPVKSDLEMDSMVDSKPAKETFGADNEALEETTLPASEDTESELTLEEIERAADDIIDPRPIEKRSDFVSQQDLDDILSGKKKPDLSEYMQPLPDQDEEEDTTETPFVSEELEGELDQSLLDSLYEEPGKEESSQTVQGDVPSEEITQDLLDELFVEPEGAGAGTEKPETSLTQDDLDRVFNESTDLADTLHSKDMDFDRDHPHPIKGTPTLEEMKRRLDELELRADRGALHPADVSEEEEYDLAGHADLDHILSFRKSEESAPPGGEIPEIELSPAGEEGSVFEPDSLAEETPVEMSKDETVETGEIESGIITHQREVQQPPRSSGISAQSLAEAVRTAPPMPRIPRPLPHRSHVEEPEIPPEEFNGPVTKTFAKLCLAQGKVEHAAYVLGKLMENNPDDPDLLKLQMQIDEKAR